MVKYKVFAASGIDSSISLGEFDTRRDAEKCMYEYIANSSTEMWGDDCVIFATKDGEQFDIPWENLSPESLKGAQSVETEADYDCVEYCYIEEEK